MGNRVVIVVGDKFAHFASGKDAITLSQLHGLLSVTNFMTMPQRHLILVPGQGLSDGDVVGLLELVAASPHRESIDVSLMRDRPNRAHARLSHKRHAANTVISTPRRIGEDLFELDLLIDDECEFMGDHQTGQHVQGMLLLEASRQSFLAVTEVFYLPADGTSRYFVIDEMSVRYRRFVFPFDARLRYQVREKDLSPTRQRFVVDVTIEQGGDTATSASFGFTVYPSDRISRKERDLADAALAAHLASAAANDAEAA